MKRYDYIIAGGGLAGLSLAYHLNQSILRTKSILIIDKDLKTKNDRTWCFWEKGEQNPFEQIVFRKWNQVYFYGSEGFAKTLDLDDYYYKWIKGIDFYDFVRTDLVTNPNIVFLNATIERIRDTPDGGFVITDQGQYMADYVFDSITPLKLNLPGQHNLLQHFKGWEIVSPKPVFDPTCPTMMDYRVEQNGTGVRFGYVLPIDSYRALVEYTLFSDKLLEPTEYDAELHTYIRDYLKIEDFSIEQEEFGVIPMTDEPADDKELKHIVRIGTSGGYVKASTGYAFSRTQRFTQQLIGQLLTVGSPVRRRKTIRSFFKGLQDSTLLNVLLYGRHSGSNIFTMLYKRNPTPRLFAFLDEDTHLMDDLRIMATVPLGAFTKGMLHALVKRL
ncbi:lycopene cyclase family protein [Rhabdobacter roseus]|uniref:Lycopene beta-cyclase n=1 Tax=Rhabdobacter roseus TaxID=1655419 RepID=A0A840TP22_9BACT|nr:lycopene cyclase family protein [Rhabdobacter roseus]MBB5285104.1 lycopene beta-cyclase [Rhabdobacter roseus]